ncbi:hypothetical protein [Pseudomonas sp. FEN]|uniref:hypothetical protein n=1 Tax=Pseudomonas sp. FEN TaxID=2767468 RepID=UPI00174E3F94|nr:hypothetical protein [Pseudomonas sp. FEN]
MNPTTLTDQLGLCLYVPETGSFPAGVYPLRLEQPANSRSRLLLELLKSRFRPVPPWDLVLQSGLERHQGGRIL